MMREIMSTKKLQLLYLFTSLVSTYCVMTNKHLVACTNAVGLICLGDLCVVQKKDMAFHHVVVLCLVHYMNTHRNNPYSNQVMYGIVSTEISTIFLTLNNLLDNKFTATKQMNKLAFISTFVYYRIYNYSYHLFLDADVRNSYFAYSETPFELCEVCGSICALFLVNVYWTLLIVDKVVGGTCRKLR